MEVRIADHELLHDSHNYYDVYFYNDRINTLVTHDTGKVSDWLSLTQKIHQCRLQNLIVGLDVEWRPSFNNYQNPVATLQLCVSHRCIVFQILRSSRECDIPSTLRDFLGNEDFTFVGVGIEADVDKLEEDYGLSVNGKLVDLRDLAAYEYSDKRLYNAGLKELASLVLEREMEKPRLVTMGRWDNTCLTPKQVQYACVDAFVSFEIGRRLNAHEY